MTLTTLRLTPQHRQVWLDQHYGEAMYVAPRPPVTSPPDPEPHLLRGIGYALWLDALFFLFVLALYLIGRRWIGV